MDLAVPINCRVKIKESKKINHRAEKPVECKGDGDTNYDSCPWNGLQRLGKETKGTRNQKKNLDPPNHRTIKINENNSKSSRNLETYSHSDFSEKTPVKSGVKALYNIHFVTGFIKVKINYIFSLTEESDKTFQNPKTGIECLIKLNWKVWSVKTVSDMKCDKR